MEISVNLYDQSQLQYLPALAGKIQTVIWYGPISSQAADAIHNHGFQVFYACDALRACNTWTLDGVTLNPKWCQYDSTSKQSFITDQNGYCSALPCGAGGTEAWFSPLGPFTFRVTIPRVNSTIQAGFDGIFLMSFNLWRDDGAMSGGACANPDWTMPIKNQVYSCIADWQQFRKVQIADMASRISQAARSSGLKVWYNDDNIYMRLWPDVVRLRERFASNLSGMQSFADGYVFEWLGTPEDNAIVDHVTFQQEIDQAVNCIQNARQGDSIGKPITLIAITGRQDVYDYLLAKASQNTFNVWTSWRFLAGLPTPPYA